MSDLEYVRVAAEADILPGQMRCFTVRDREILVCHTADGFFAVDAICSHAYARLDEGRLRANRVLCPRHGAAFDVRDGKALAAPATKPIGSHRVRLEDGGVLVEIGGSE